MNNNIKLSKKVTLHHEKYIFASHNVLLLPRNDPNSNADLSVKSQKNGLKKLSGISKKTIDSVIYFLHYTMPHPIVKLVYNSRNKDFNYSLRVWGEYAAVSSVRFNDYAFVGCVTN